MSPSVARGGNDTIAVLGCEPAVTSTRGSEKTYQPKLGYEATRFIPYRAPNAEAAPTGVNGCMLTRAWPREGSTKTP